MEFLQNIDTSLFYFINKTLANPVTDKWMPVITESKSWYIFYVIILGYLLIKGGPRGRVAVGLILVLILITDQSTNFLKEWIGRVRPCHALPDVNLLVGCASVNSMPSNHAVNNFAAAFLFSHFYPNMKYALFTGAFIVAISRVFCGVHYPGDIFAGAVIGIIWGAIIVIIWEALDKKLHIIKKKK